MAIKDIVKGFCDESKCLFDVYTKTGADKNFARKEDMGTIAGKNYSRGTGIPSGGSDGDIYDQYF